MLTVIAILNARPGREKDLEAALLELIPPTRREEGCVNYDLHRSHDDPGRFIFYENWTSREAWNQHMAMPYLKDFFSKADDLLSESAEVGTYDMISEPVTGRS